MIELNASDHKEILRYAGYKGGTLDEVTLEKLNKAVDITNDVIDPRTVWKLCSLDMEKEQVYITDFNLTLPGASIKKALCGCEKAVLLCVTIGTAFDVTLSKLMLTDKALGVLVNAAGVQAVEKLADTIQKEIDKEVSPLKTLPRFSPGYGDLPLEIQSDLIRILNTEKQAGVRLNSSFLMNPSKSVTAIAGLKKVTE